MLLQPIAPQPYSQILSVGTPDYGLRVQTPFIGVTELSENANKNHVLLARTPDVWLLIVLY